MATDLRTALLAMQARQGKKMLLPLAPGVVPKQKLPAILPEFADWHYALGSKVDPLSQQGRYIVGTPDPRGIDCSGYALYELYHLTEGAVSLDPETTNSAALHQWFIDQGYEPCQTSDGHLQDGRVRFWFLTPAQGGGIGHVLCTCDGVCYESHGSKGPDGSRGWGSVPFMSDMAGFLAT